MKSDCVNSFGHAFVSKVFWHIGVRTVVVASPPSLATQEILSLLETFLLSV